MPDLSGYRPASERPVEGNANGFGRLHDQAYSTPPPFERTARPGQGNAQRNAGPRNRPRRRRNWMRPLAYVIGGVTVAIVASAAALAIFTPVDLVRDRLISEVKARTGRDLRVAGGTSLTFYPSLGVMMGDVSLSAPPQMGGGKFLTTRRLEVRVALVPLLRRRILVDRLILTEPVFDLRVDRAGRTSWDFADAAPANAARSPVLVAQGPRTAQPSAPARGTVSDALPPELEDFVRNSSQGSNEGTNEGANVGASEGGSATAASGSQPTTTSRSSATIQDLSLGDVRVVGGIVRYRDERNGQLEEISGIDAKVSAVALTSPMDAKGAFDLRGERVAFEARLTTPRALLDERPVKVAMNVTSPRAAFRYQGGLTLKKGVQLDGAIKADLPSVREFVSWLGVLPSALPTIGALSIEGDVRTGPTSFSMTNGRLALDELRATGSANVDLAGTRPKVKADLDFAAINLNPYLDADAAAPPQDAKPSLPAEPLPRIIKGGQKGGDASGASSSGPKVKGYTGSSGWREDPINLLFLSALEADLKVATKSLVYRELKIGTTRLAISIRNNQMRTTFDEVRLYGGAGRGVVTLDANASGAAIGANITLDGVEALPFLKDWSGFDWIDGKGKMQVAVAGQGRHQRAIMESLNGKADFTFTNGAIVGYNVPQIIKGLSQGRISGLNRSPNERTEFTEAGANFAIRNGIAETKDLHATSAMLRITGTGTANIGQRQLDLILRPRLGGNNQQAGELSGLELPVRVRGSWEKPSVTPDMDGILKNPGQAVDAIKEIGRQIQQGKGGNLNQLIDQFRRR